MADFRKLTLRLPPQLYAQIEQLEPLGQPIALKIRELLERLIAHPEHLTLPQDIHGPEQLQPLTLAAHEPLAMRVEALEVLMQQVLAQIAAPASRAAQKPRMTHKPRAAQAALATHNYNPETHKLGKLCKWGHEWQDTGKSLRRKHDSKCLLCDKATSRQYRKRKEEN